MDQRDRMAKVDWMDWSDQNWSEMDRTGSNGLNWTTVDWRDQKGTKCT